MSESALSPTFRLVRFLVIGAVVGFLVAAGALGAFHCDEANVVRHVTRFADGDWGRPGRPGFLWLLLSPSLLFDSPVASVLAMRAAAVGASLGTLALVWRIVQDDDPDDRIGPLLAVALLGASMSWQAHSFEVRTDTFVVPMTLLAGWAVVRPSVTFRQALLAGLALGAACVFSQKTVYNVAALGAGGAFAAISMRVPGREIGRTIVGVAVGAAVGVGAWYGLLAVISDPAAVGEGLGKAAKNAWSNKRSLAVNLKTLGGATAVAPGLYLVGLAAVLGAWRWRRERPRAAAFVVVFAAMASTMFVHRGFFPYFIASFEPYLAIAAGGLGAELWTRVRASRRPRAAWVGAAVVFVATCASAPQALRILDADSGRQFEVMREADALFDGPVPHWDSTGLMAGYPETTFFNTQAVRMGFRERQGRDVYVQLARERKPQFLIRNYMTRTRTLREGERKWLWRHFLPYRNNLYLRGGRVAAGPDRRSTKVDLAADGAYTVHFRGGWTGTARVNGRAVADGEVVTLTGDRASLSAIADEGGGQLWILFGADRVPMAESEERLDWSMYPTLRRSRHQSYDHRKRGRDLLTQPDRLSAEGFERRRQRHLAHLKRAERKYDGR